MVGSINSVLKKARDEAATAKKDKIPDGIKEDDVSMMVLLLNLLEPFASLTDSWQGDGVTSSLVLLGLINALKCNLYFILF